jgi:hypothetical protein
MHFVAGSLVIVFLRDTSSKHSNVHIFTDYGVSVFTYRWAVELGIKVLMVARLEGFSPIAIDSQSSATTGAAVTKSE